MFNIELRHFTLSIPNKKTSLKKMKFCWLKIDIGYTNSLLDEWSNARDVIGHCSNSISLTGRRALDCGSYRRIYETEINSILLKRNLTWWCPVETRHRFRSSINWRSVTQTGIRNRTAFGRTWRRKTTDLSNIWYWHFNYVRHFLLGR
jgi:hypothetical protein